MIRPFSLQYSHCLAYMLHDCLTSRLISGMLVAIVLIWEENMTMDIEAGKYLARLRNEAGLKQNELAQKVTWSPTILSRVESGERPVTPDELNSILEAIGTEKALELRETAGRVWQHLSKPPFGHPDESMLWAAEEAFEAIEDLLAKPDIKNLFAKRLDEFKKGLHAATRLVHSTEHSIAFVGDIGVGKSTGICRILALEVPSAKSPVPEPVLEVGGGGVTVCEVHVVHGPEFGLLIEPRSEQEIHREVHEFANLLKNPLATTQEDDAEDTAFGTSKEIERAIRNMSGLTRKTRREKGSDGEVVRVTEDPAKNLAEGCADTGSFVVEILARMNLSRRTKRELWYPVALSSKEPLGWLKDNFEKLNNGRHPDFSIPKRVEVLVPDPILGEKSLSIRLIDTKGIDRTAERGDIENLFSEPNTIVVMCSTFNATPSPSVQQLLDRAVKGGFTGMEYKTAVLGLPRYHEALAVKDDAGITAETIEDGYELKREEAENLLTAVGVTDVPVEFFNAFQDDAKRLRDFLLELVEELRKQHGATLQEAIDDARTLVDDHEQQQTREVQKTAAMSLATWSRDNHSLDFSSVPGLEQSLIGAIHGAHPSSVRASVRREGEWYNLDYSNQLSYGARLVANRVISPKLTKLNAIAENMLQNPQLEEASGLVRQVRRVIDSGADDLLKKCQLAGVGIHGRDMKPSTRLWSGCDSEWGKGLGYRDRVVGRHRGWFDNGNRDYQKDLQDLIEKEWHEILHRLSDILDEVLGD